MHRLTSPLRVLTSSSVTALTMVRAVLGLALAILGTLMVTDHLSLRDLLAETGPEAAHQAVLGLYPVIEHQGAQLAELAGALLGVALVVSSARRLRRIAR